LINFSEDVLTPLFSTFSVFDFGFSSFPNKLGEDMGFFVVKALLIMDNINDDDFFYSFSFLGDNDSQTIF